MEGDQVCVVDGRCLMECDKREELASGSEDPHIVIKRGMLHTDVVLHEALQVQSGGSGRWR